MLIFPLPVDLFNAQDGLLLLAADVYFANVFIFQVKVICLK